jgi:hypothetical protein
VVTDFYFAESSLADFSTDGVVADVFGFFLFFLF